MDHHSEEWQDDVRSQGRPILLFRFTRRKTGGALKNWFLFLFFAGIWTLFNILRFYGLFLLFFFYCFFLWSFPGKNVSSEIDFLCVLQVSQHIQFGCNYLGALRRLWGPGIVSRGLAIVWWQGSTFHHAHYGCRLFR